MDSTTFLLIKNIIPLGIGIFLFTLPGFQPIMDPDTILVIKIILFSGILVFLYGWSNGVAGGWMVLGGGFRGVGVLGSFVFMVLGLLVAFVDELLWGFDGVFAGA